MTEAALSGPALAPQADYRLLIGGTLQSGAGSITVLNPATEAPVADCPTASQAQLDEAVAAARRAFPGWAAIPIAERGQVLGRIADRMEQHKDAIARVLTLEQGKPLGDAIYEVQASAAAFRYFGSLDLPSVEIERNERHVVVAHRRPLGVVGTIIPWNFPLFLLASKIAPALMAGNSVIAKPAPTTPLSTLLLGELIHDLLPAGVLNVIADANDLGGALSSHPGVDKISFTGSTATGKKVMASATDTLKRLTLELGGNDAAIVLGDVDPAKIAPALFGAAFANNGQVCLAIKRLYVHDTVYDAVVDRLAQLADAAIVGDGMQQGTQFGPVQNRMQFEKMQGFLADAHADGTVVAGAADPRSPGYFVRPTIVRDIADGSRLVDEEQFGPILPVIRFADVDVAVDAANASDFGLGASVWSTDTARAHQIGARLDVGTVWINQHLDFGVNIPFGGAKQSGFGLELGEDGLKEFTQLRIINEAL